MAKQYAKSDLNAALGRVGSRNPLATPGWDGNAVGDLIGAAFSDKFF